MKPIAITIGEPAGIGPDILLKILKHSFARPLVIITDRDLLLARAAKLKLDVDLPLYSNKNTNPPAFSVDHRPLKVACIPGKPNPDNAAWVIATLQRAVAGCMNGEFAGIVNGPVNKAVINEGGIPFTGHTELLAELSHTPKVVMLFVFGHLRLALVTIHVALKEVPTLITADNLEKTIQVVHDSLQKTFQIANPKILVLGLNPHAGERGVLGKEEITIIQPTIKKMCERGMQILGPLAADTAFWWIKQNPVDVIVSMYHDQSLPVIKTLGLGEVVNVTLGLPFIRTAVDHGTAFDRAGTDAADATSMLSATELAITLAR